MSFICPVCSLPLKRAGGAYICPKRHSFDIARQGYVNLLTGSGKGVHGDDKEMVAARRRFMDTGSYAPLADALAEITAGTKGLLLDAGCGEGYFTRAVQLASPGTEITGIDISRDAVRFAPKRCPGADFAVASAFRLPLGDGCCNAVMCVCAPVAAEEFRRVIVPGGMLITASPGARHLWQLKKAVYEEPYENDPPCSDYPGFSLKYIRRVMFSIRLNESRTVEDLFAMTPYSHRTGGDGIARMKEIKALDDRAEFIVSVFDAE